MKSKLISVGVACLSIGILVYKYMALTPGSFIEVLPQMFQHFNPFFVVALTPVSLAVFGALAKRGKEPSAPRKIGIGMLIAALGFTIMAFFSIGPSDTQPGRRNSRCQQFTCIPFRTYQYLPCTDFCGTVPFTDGYFLRVKGSSSQIQRAHDGYVVRRHRYR